MLVVKSSLAIEFWISVIVFECFLCCYLIVLYVFGLDCCTLNIFVIGTCKITIIFTCKNMASQLLRRHASSFAPLLTTVCLSILYSLGWLGKKKEITTNSLRWPRAIHKTAKNSASERFVSLTDEDLERFVEAEANKNTQERCTATWY